MKSSPANGRVSVVGFGSLGVVARPKYWRIFAVDTPRRTLDAAFVVGGLALPLRTVSAQRARGLFAARREPQLVRSFFLDLCGSLSLLLSGSGRQDWPLRWRVGRVFRTWLRVGGTASDAGTTVRGEATQSVAYFTGQRSHAVLGETAQSRVRNNFVFKRDKLVDSSFEVVLIRGGIHSEVK